MNDDGNMVAIVLIKISLIAMKMNRQHLDQDIKTQVNLHEPS